MISDLLRRILDGRAHIEDGDGESVEVIKARFRAMVRPAVGLTFNQGEAVRDDPHSSIGGRPSLVPGEDWPVDGEGRPMLFLAQINYADMPSIPGYPNEGLLSVFVADDGQSGCDFPSRNQSGFLTRFHPHPENMVRASEGPDPRNDNYGKELRRLGAPLYGKAVDGLPTSVLPMAEAIIGELSDSDADEVCDWLLDQRPGTIYYGGCPDFIQYDIREEGAPETEVLLQQGHHYEKDRKWEICWGDAGEATFLLSEGDLAERRFENSIYSWDCS